MPAKILIVDDEVLVAESMRVVLRQSGYAITDVVTDADAALVAIVRERPDVVLMDINLGHDHEGIAAAEIIRTRHSLPVIYVTAYADEVTLAQAKITHPFGYVTKPFEARDLQVAIEIALYNRVLEQRLQESELKFRTFVQEAGDGFELLDEHGRFLEVNGATCRQLGYTREEMLRLNIADVDPFLPREKFVQSFKDGVDRTPVTIESVHRRKDGSNFPVEVTFSVIEVGGERRALSLVRDITVRRQAEAALRESEEKFAKAFRDSPVGLAIRDGETGCYIDVNDRCLAMTGYTRDEVIGRSPLAIGWMVEGDQETNRRLFTSPGGPSERELRLRRKDGHTIICSYTSHEVHIGGRACLLSITVDITARKEAEAAREALSQALVRKNRELENLVYVTSHDLRSPMLNIQGFTRRIEERCQDIMRLTAAETLSAAERAEIAAITTEVLPQAITYVHTSVDKMDRLIGGLLRLSRVGRVGLKTESLDLANMFREILDTMAYTIQNAGAVVEVAPLPGCHGDAGQVNQLFANLLDNALKYRDPVRPLRVTVSGREDGRRTVYCVADTGVGIAPGNLDKIWDIFFRGNPRGGVGGEGLGLNLARRIVERNQGEIWVESTVGEGSRFYVALPRLQDDAPAQAEGSGP